MGESTTSSSADRVTQAATELFVEKGYAATSMSAVAKAAGMQKASLYHHFSSKEMLFFACVTSGYSQVIEELGSLRADYALSHEEKLRRAISIAHKNIVSSPIGRMSPIIAETSRMIPTVAQRFREDYIDPMHASVAALVEDGIKDGAFRRLDPVAFELLVFGPIVYLSLSRQMFGSLSDTVAVPDPGVAQSAHIEEVVRMLKVDA